MTTTTELPSTTPPPNGHSGAWPIAGGIVVQGSADCSTAWIVTLGAEGEVAGGIPGNLLVGIHDSVAVVKTWDDCGQISGSIDAYATSGEHLRELVAAGEDIGGIGDVLSLAEPHQSPP